MLWTVESSASVALVLRWAESSDSLRAGFCGARADEVRMPCRLVVQELPGADESRHGRVHATFNVQTPVRDSCPNMSVVCALPSPEPGRAGTGKFFAYRALSPRMLDDCAYRDASRAPGELLDARAPSAPYCARTVS